MQFAANISTLCRDIPNLKDRFVHIINRKDFPFQEVECQDPYSVPLTEWQSLSQKYPHVSWSLINSPPLFQSFPDRLPDRPEFEKAILSKVIDYATGLKCPKVHLVMADNGTNARDIDDKIIDLISFAADVLQPHGITCLLEPLSIRPSYWLRSYDKGEAIMKQLGGKNVQLLLDTYHLQMLHGNVTESIKRLAPVSGHVQVSQAPLRDSPMAAGELNYDYILKRVAESYKGTVGLEYFSNSDESFSWLNGYADL